MKKILSLLVSLLCAMFFSSCEKTSDLGDYVSYSCTPMSLTMSVGDKQDLKFTGSYSNGTKDDLTSQCKFVISAESGDQGVISLTGNSVTALKKGVAKIMLEYKGLTLPGPTVTVK